MAARFLALVGCTLAVVAMGAEVTSLDAEKGDWTPSGDLVYKISFTTAPKGECYGNSFRGSSLEAGEIPPNHYIGNCKVVIDELVGTKGTITNKIIAGMPGFVCKGAGQKEHKCKVSELGWTPDSSDMDAAGCKCQTFAENQDYSGYNKVDAFWRPCANPSECHQTVYMVGADIGELTKLTLKVDGQFKPQWNMQSMRITPYKVAQMNNNWVKTPINNGVYYISTAKVMDGSNTATQPKLVAELGGTTSTGSVDDALQNGEACSANSDCKSGKCDVDGVFKMSNGDSCEEKCLAVDADENTDQDKNCQLPLGVASMTRCDATSCEEEMNTKLGYEQEYF